jgi:hypothetical protein
MSITFKPYTALGLGKMFRMVSYEFDNDRNLTIHGFIGTDALIKLTPSHSATRVLAPKLLTRAASRVFDVGDVEVTGPGFKRVFENISPVNQFIQAVHGTHPDVQPIKPLWFKQYSDKDLEDFEIRIPKLDEGMFTILKYGLQAYPLDGRIVELSQNTDTETGALWVERGQPILSYNGLIVLSPCTGRIKYRGSDVGIGDWSSKDNWPKLKGSPVADLPNDIFMSDKYALTIQPVKGLPIIPNLSTSYANITQFMSDIAASPQNFPAYYEGTENREAARKFIRENVAMLNDARFRKGPLSTAEDHTPVTQRPPEVSL